MSVPAIKQEMPERLSADFHYRGPRSPQGQVLQKNLDELVSVIHRYELSIHDADKYKGDRTRNLCCSLHDVVLNLKSDIEDAETEFFRAQFVDERLRIETCAQYLTCGILWVVDEYTDDPKALAYSDTECPHCREGHYGGHHNCGECFPKPAVRLVDTVVRNERQKVRDRLKALRAESERLLEK